MVGDAYVSSTTERVLTTPVGGGPAGIQHYLVGELITTLNSTVLLPHHRKVSQCLELCAHLAPP